MRTIHNLYNSFEQGKINLLLYSGYREHANLLFWKSKNTETHRCGSFIHSSTEQWTTCSQARSKTVYRGCRRILKASLCLQNFKNFSYFCMRSETVEQRPEAPPMSNHENVQTAVQTHGIHRYREEGWVDLWNIIQKRAEWIRAEPRTLTAKFSLCGFNWCYHANAKALNGKGKDGASSQTAADKGRGISGLTLFWWLCQGQTSDSDKKRQRSNEGEFLFF